MSRLNNEREWRWVQKPKNDENVQHARMTFCFSMFIVVMFIYIHYIRRLFSGVFLLVFCSWKAKMLTEMTSGIHLRKFFHSFPRAKNKEMQNDVFFELLPLLCHAAIRSFSVCVCMITAVVHWTVLNMCVALPYTCHCVCAGRLEFISGSFYTISARCLANLPKGFAMRKIVYYIIVCWLVMNTIYIHIYKKVLRGGWRHCAYIYTGSGGANECIQCWQRTTTTSFCPRCIRAP